MPPLSAFLRRRRQPQPMAMALVATYRGIDAGWVPAGQPRPVDDAQRLLSLIQRIRPDYPNKIVNA